MMIRPGDGSGGRAPAWVGMDTYATEGEPDPGGGWHAIALDTGSAVPRVTPTNPRGPKKRRNEWHLTPEIHAVELERQAEQLKERAAAMEHEAAVQRLVARCTR